MHMRYLFNELIEIKLNSTRFLANIFLHIKKSISKCIKIIYMGDDINFTVQKLIKYFHF